MKIKTLEDFQTKEIISKIKTSYVKVKKMNNILEITYNSNPNRECYIRKLDKDNYLNLKTGEVKECNHIESRADNSLQVSQSLKKLRDYINNNVSDPTKCLWVTLTYEREGIEKKPMRDTKRLYSDTKEFIRKLRKTLGHFEYIIAREPQGDGTWHSHCIFIFTKKYPYIANKKLAELWGQGFTKTQKLNNVDNVGAYLTAYLGDMSLSECKKYNINYSNKDIKEVEEIDGIKLNKPKKFIKGARLCMYPPKFNIYTVSKGIKKPISYDMVYQDVIDKYVIDKKPTYQKGIALQFENEEEEKKINCNNLSKEDFTYLSSKKLFNTNSNQKFIVYENYNLKRN